MAYDKVMTRIEHFEDMLVTIGTVSLAILAGIGGVVFTQDSRLFPEASARGAATTLTESQRQAHCDKVYAGIVTLTVLTSVAYTHVFRYYCNCYSYACELEIRLFSDARSRLNSSIWADMSIGAPAWLTYSFIGLYSVAVSIATVILFGRHFHQSKTRQSAIAWTLLLLALAYVTPSISRYMATVRLAQGH